jgi:RimJ/RimL family protein N-acetyltransferase
MFPSKMIISNSEELTIKKADEDDATQIIKYIKQVLEESDYFTIGLEEFEKTKGQQRKDIKNMAKNPNNLFLLATINNKIVGFLNFKTEQKRRTSHVGEFGVSVLKNKWGLNIGSALLNALLGWIKTRKQIKKINLQVRSDNTRAIALYRKYGFQNEGLIKKAVFLENKFYDYSCMGLEVN